MSVALSGRGSPVDTSYEKQESLLEEAEREREERPILLDLSLLDQSKPKAQAEPSLYPKEGEQEEISTERISRGNPFHVNRAARDSRNETLFAKRLTEEFINLGEDLERTIERMKGLPSNLSQVEALAQLGNSSTSALNEISTTLSNLRDRVTIVLPSAATEMNTSPGAGITNLGRDGSQSLHRIASETQMNQRPEPITFIADPVDSLIQDARGTLHDISSSLSSIEARLVANCGLSPFGNEESLQQLDLLRLVKERVEEVDQRLRDMQST